MKRVPFASIGFLSLLTYASLAACSDGGGDGSGRDGGTTSHRDADTSSCGYVHDASYSEGEPSGFEGTTEAHNEWRYLVGTAPLRWSPAIAAHAQDWADNLAGMGCGLQHSSNEERQNVGGFSQLGQNLAGGGGQLTGAGATELWAGERTSYPFGTEISQTNFRAFGHYTQIVWSTTTHVGCGRASCGGSSVVVCEYGPAGNFLGEAAYPYVEDPCVDLDNDGVLQAVDSDDTDD